VGAAEKELSKKKDRRQRRWELVIYESRKKEVYMIESVGWDASISHTLPDTKDCKKIEAS
jgi:hypothetical protein